MDNKKTAGSRPIIIAAALIVAFSIVLWAAIASLGTADGGIKSAPGAPDSLVSAGAPRSQLELKRIFEAMSLTYEEGGLSVYEPVSSEYRSALGERIAAGESFALSVEEMLFVISDTVAAYDKYDVIRFKDGSGNIEKEFWPIDAAQTEDNTLAASALGKISEVARIIELRVKVMSTSDSLTETSDGELKYIPRQVNREGNGGDTSEKAFLFGLHAGIENYSEAVIFLPGNGSRITLYPSSNEAWLCRTKVILQTQRTATEAERSLLMSEGVDPERSRNITPEYFYGEISVRLFVFGGRAILLDPEVGDAILLLPESERITSTAIARTGEGGEAELYFTSSSEKGSSVWRYAVGSGRTEKLFESADEYLAVSEPIGGDYSSASVYRAAKREDERFVITLECIGEPIAAYFAK